VDVFAWNIWLVLCNLLGDISLEELTMSQTRKLPSALDQREFEAGQRFVAYEILRQNKLNIKAGLGKKNMKPFMTGVAFKIFSLAYFLGGEEECGGLFDMCMTLVDDENGISE